MVFENRISGIEPFTLLDFKDNLAAILFYTGCNLRCLYCYNGSVVLNSLTRINSEEITTFINKRKGKLDAFVFSGGECTSHGQNLIDDISYVKENGFKVKVDTNGTNPLIVKKLVESNLVDYIALDIKAPENKANIFYDKLLYKNVIETLTFLIDNGFNFEARTTVHSDIINEEDVNMIIKELEKLNYKGNYYIQFYFPVDKTLGNVSNNPRYFDITKINQSQNINVQYRNIESNKK